MKRHAGYWTVYFTLMLALLIPIGFIPGISPALYPSLPQPQILVETHWPQAGAEEVDREITLPLYAALSRIPGLRKTRSRSSHGLSRIHLSFTAACQPAKALHRVQSAVGRAANRLPVEAHSPHVRRRSRADRPVFAVAVPMESAAEATGFRRRISRLQEITVAESRPSGCQTSLRLNYKYALGLHRGISSLKAASLLRSRSFTASVNGMSLLPARELKSPQLDGVVSRPKNAYIRAKPVHRFNGVRQHIITCYVNERSNHIQLCRRLLALCDEFPSVKVIYNHGEDLERILLSTGISVLCGICTITLLLVGQLRVCNRETVLLITSLPIVLCTALSVAATCNLSINIMSLSALAVGSGLVVDAAVLFYEESYRIGASAAVKAVKPAILMSNLTTLSIFIPVLLLPPSIRHNLQGFMLMMTVILATGTLWTLIVFPRLCRDWEVRTHLHFAYHMRYRRNIILLRLLSRKRWLCLLLYAGVCLLPLVGIGRVEFRTFPHIRQRTLHLQIEFPAGTQPNYIDAVMQPYFSQVRQLEQVESVSVSSHSGQASFTLSCSSSSHTATVKSRLQQIPLPAGASLIQPGATGSCRPFLLRMYAGDPIQLRTQLKDLAGRIQSDYPAYRVYYHFKSAAPIYSLCFDANRCGYLPIPPARAAQQIHRIISSGPAAKIGINRQKDLLLQPAPSPIDFSDFYSSFRIVADSSSLPLSELSSLTRRPGKGDLQRLNGALFSGLTLIPDSGRTLDAVTRIEKLLYDFTLPAGCSIEIAPVLYRERGQIRWVGAAILLASILLPLLLYSYFGHWSQTLFVLSYIPPALALPLPVLTTLDIPLSLPVLTGFLVNVGLSVNNALVLLAEKPQQSLRASDLPRQLCLKLPSLTASTLTTASGVLPLLFAASGSGGVLSGLSIVIAIGAFASWAMLFLSSAVLSPPSRAPYLAGWKKFFERVRKTGPG